MAKGEDVHRSRILPLKLPRYCKPYQWQSHVIHQALPHENMRQSLMQEPAETISGTYQQYVPFLQQSSFQYKQSQLLSIQNLYPVITPGDEHTLKLLREKRLLFGLQDAPETGALVATGAKFIWSCSEDTRPCHPLEMTVDKSPSVG